MNRQMKRIVDSLLSAPSAPEPEPEVPEAEEAERIVREIFRRVFDLQELGSLSFVGSYRTYRPQCGDVRAWVTLAVESSHPSCDGSAPVMLWSDDFRSDMEAEEALAAVRRRIEDQLVNTGLK